MDGLKLLQFMKGPNKNKRLRDRAILHLKRRHQYSPRRFHGWIEVITIHESP
jgi:hypothetical protein